MAFHDALESGSVVGFMVLPSNPHFLMGHFVDQDHTGMSPDFEQTPVNANLVLWPTLFWFGKRAGLEQTNPIFSAGAVSPNHTGIFRKPPTKQEFVIFSVPAFEGRVGAVRLSGLRFFVHYVNNSENATGTNMGLSMPAG